MTSSLRPSIVCEPGHSKKFGQHCHMVALYTVWYNFVRINTAVKMSPAMGAGVSSRLWEMSDIVALIDAREEAPKRPATYRKRGDEISN